MMMMNHKLGWNECMDFFSHLLLRRHGLMGLKHLAQLKPCRPGVVRRPLLGLKTL